MSEMLGGDASRDIARDIRKEIGGCIVDCIAQFNHPPRVFEDLRSGVSHPQPPRGTFDQTHS